MYQGFNKKALMGLALAASFQLKDPFEADVLLAKANLEFASDKKDDTENAVKEAVNALLERGESIEDLINMQFTFELFEGAILASRCGAEHAVRNNEPNSNIEGWFVLQELKAIFGQLCANASLQEHVDQSPFIGLHERYKAFRNGFPSCEQESAKALEAALEIFATSKDALTGEDFKKTNMFGFMRYLESMSI